MNKKGALQFITIVIVALILIAIILLVRNYQRTGNPLANSITYISESSTATITNTDTHYLKHDLCNVMQPYILPSGIQNECTINGGSWVCNDVFVGCKNLPVAIVTCSGPMITTAIYQCEQLGGDAVCNPTNLYCTY